MRLPALLAAVLACTVASAPVEFSQSGGTRVAAVTVSPNPMALEPGDLGAATCTPTNGKGTALKMTCSWVSSDPTVASVTTTASQSMGVTARKVGSAQITVTVTGTSVRATLAVTVSDTTKPPPVDTTPPPPPPPPPPVDTNHVGPQVRTPAEASQAFAGTRGQGGDTVWFRTGQYPGESTVRAAGRIFRCWPGERCTLGNVYGGASSTLWGFEVDGRLASPNGTTGLMGVNLRAPNIRLINNVIHHSTMSGVGFWMEAPNSEATGNIVYHNGTHGNRDHGFYVQNSTGTKLLRDNLVFDNSAYGFHLYGEAGQYVRGITLQGNISWQNGFSTAGPKDDYIIASTEVVSGIALDSNATYRTARGEQTARLPWEYGPKHLDLTLRDNYFVGAVSIPPTRWTTLTQSGTTVIGASAPTQTRVMLRLNPYERGRANVAVWNWGNDPSVTVTVPGLKAYRVVRPDTFYGAPVATGTGPTVTIPVAGTFAAFVILPSP